MEITSLAIPVVDRIEKCIQEGIDQYRKFSNNFAVVDQLYETIKRLKRQLVLLDRKSRELEPEVLCLDDHLFLRLVASTLHQQLKSIEGRLEKGSGMSRRTGKVNETARGLTGAISVCQMLKDCENDAVAVEHRVKEYYNIALGIQQAEASGAKGHDSGAQDCFRASFDVEKNPDHVVLHYGPIPRSGEERYEAVVSPEAQLKRAVLRFSEAHDITVAVACLGMGGVGKSCALRGLAADEDVRRQFHDGVYMMVLGEKASKVDVVKGLSDIVKRSGGRTLAQNMWKERGDVREVLSQVRAWFQSRRILLLVDDAWENSEVSSSIIGQLHRFVVSGQSRLALATRHASVAWGHETIKFGERDVAASREILLKAAGVRLDSTGSFEDDVDEVVELCAGLPLALVIAGKDIAGRICYLGVESWREACAETLTTIESSAPAVHNQRLKLRHT